MEHLGLVRQLVAAGRFGDALRTLDAIPISRGGDQRAAEVLKAELLERVGRLGQSQALVEVILKTKDLAPSDRSACEFLLGRIEWENGNADVGIFHIQRSASTAAQCGDLRRLCWSQIRLLLSISGRSDPAATLPLMADLRLNVAKLGDSQVTAGLHILIGQMEARRGLLDNAQRHTRIGQRIMLAAPSVWLEAMAENTNLNIAVMRSDFDIALDHGRRALQLADESGAATVRRASLVNMGNLLYLLGRFDEAVQLHEATFTLIPSTGEHNNAVLEGLAQIRLVQDRFTECAELLDSIDRRIHQATDRGLYTYRHVQLTRTRLLARQGRWADALEISDSLAIVATEAGDHLLHNMALLTKAELLCQSDNTLRALAVLDGMAISSSSYPDLYAHYERILACALAAAGDMQAARFHFDRAKRVYESIRNVPGLLELSRSWDLATSQAASRPAPSTEPPARPDGAARARTVLHTASALMLHAGRHELLAREIVHLLAETNCVQTAIAVARASDGSTETLASTAQTLPAEMPAAKRIAVGVARDRAVEVLVDPKPDIESVATLNAVMLLLATVHDLERARAEREERLTLWPIDDVPIEGGQAVVSGQMRELMGFARRIAGTNVSVLITGESGTGKEILARAIHNFSSRAHKPFIPFNCTAVPREMLESQMFGHRRGSFTGADRDNPGLIRGAREGTLFLDEIGELGIDLQPKLLRFLESGEICPLGDPTPFTVDVRVIAATNSNLEESVRDGRFREDLFYRLNVIRLRIPPLRERRDEIPGLVSYFVGRAAEEFRKGQVRLAEETMEYLLLYPWPGNVRQLNNELRRMVALADRDAVLTPAQLSNDILSARPAPERRINGSEIAVSLHDKLLPALSRVEREMIRVALREHQGVDAAARALGISRKGLYLKRQRLGL